MLTHFEDFWALSGPRNCENGSASFLAPETGVMGQILGPETEKICPFLDLTLWARDTISTKTISVIGFKMLIFLVKPRYSDLGKSVNA
jgi:hypothetical protein